MIHRKLFIAEGAEIAELRVFMAHLAVDARRLLTHSLR